MTTSDTELTHTSAIPAAPGASPTPFPTSSTHRPNGSQNGGVRRSEGKSPALAEHHVDGAALKSDQGVTTIAQAVVAKIASIATQEIPGVHSLGSGTARAMGALRNKIPGASSTSTPGIAVEVGESQAAVDIEIVAEYGESIIEVANAVRDNVIGHLEAMLGLEVVEVNISIDDLYVADEQPDGEARVA